MDSLIPKQFLELKGKPILMHTIQKFFNYNNSIKIILVLPKEQFEIWETLCEKHNFKIKTILVEGGKERFFSVKNGLQYINKNELVAIHDGVRPLINNELIETGFNTAKNKKTAIPYINITQSVRKKENEKFICVNRNDFILIQTPQIFLSDLLLKAYELPFDEQYTDDSSIVEKITNEITYFKGLDSNIKITNKIDLIIAESLIETI